MFPTGFRKQTWILMNTICPYPFRFIHMIWTSEVKEFMMNTSQATPRWPWSSSWGLGRASSYGWKDLLHRPQHKVSLTRDCFLSIVPAIFDLLTIDKHTHRLTQWEDPRISNPQIAGQVHQWLIVTDKKSWKESVPLTHAHTLSTRPSPTQETTSGNMNIWSNS